MEKFAFQYDFAGLSYSKFINGLEKAGIEINRKVLSELAINEPETFKSIVETAKAALEGKTVKAEVKEVAKKAVEKAEDVKEEVEDLAKKTVAELKELAKEKKIANYTAMKKAELLDALRK